MNNPPAAPSVGQAALFGLGAASVTALVYGVLADPFGLSWGLIVVGAAGGYLIGRAVQRGAFGSQFHLRIPRLQWLAVLFAVITWIAASAVAYVASQLFYQGATTPLADRLSVGGYLEYLNGTVFSPSILGLAAMAFVAWRSAR